VSRRFTPNDFIHNPDRTTSIFLERRDGTRLICAVSSADFNLVRSYRWSVHVKRHTNYAETRTGGAKVRLHQLLSPSVEVDHIDGNGLNNQRTNLRPVTEAQNSANRKKTGGRTSTFKGVNWQKHAQKWRAEIRVGGKNFHLGYFVNEQDAAKAYNAAALQHYGEFAKLNDICSLEIGKAA
jgi:hypothetical protein